jgi:hypothetical protein
MYSGYDSGIERDIDLLLKWRQTWPDKDADFVADSTTYHGNIGRIYRVDHDPMAGKWFWAVNAFGAEISRNIGALSGHADSLGKRRGRSNALGSRLSRGAAWMFLRCR